MKDEQKWPAMHAYRKAVAMGEAPAIKCPDCQGELVPVVGRDTLPALRCLACRTTWEPGLAIWDQIRANISEVVQTFEDRDREIERN